MKAEELRLRIAQLEDALRPFAEAAEDLDDAHRDEGYIWEAPAALSITAGDLRLARSLLDTQTEIPSHD